MDAGWLPHSESARRYPSTAQRVQKAGTLFRYSHVSWIVDASALWSALDRRIDPSASMGRHNWELEENGTVVRLGQQVGTATPLNFAVYAALKPYVEGTTGLTLGMETTGPIARPLFHKRLGSARLDCTPGGPNRLCRRPSRSSRRFLSRGRCRSRALDSSTRRRGPKFAATVGRPRGRVSSRRRRSPRRECCRRYRLGYARRR